MKKGSNTVILVLFMLGIFMGAIDSGIVSPAREIIESGFGIERNIGIWMITIYTLSYTISMLIVSKLSDRYGHKVIYTLSITVFGLGSLLCGLTNFYGDFSLFLAARVIQAIGAGGIMPIANTVIGLSFPKEKRGMALGLVGGIYGVATIIGPTLGSTILSFAGTTNWGFIFFINVPITIAILLLSLKMENTKLSTVKPMDIKGSIVIAGLIGSFLYALMNLDFFQFKDSLSSIKVYPYLILVAVLIPILIWIERRAIDPVLNLKYFKNKQMIVIFVLAFIVGIGMMGMVFIPQFAENILKIKPGTGGYLITFMALFSGISAPLSGKLIDIKGARFVMLMGFGFTILGTLYLGYVATNYMSLTNILIGLGFMGFGLGFTLGAPLNYLVLQAVPESEGATGLATMSLIRSMGTTISPGLLIGFVVNSAKDLQPNLMGVLAQGGITMPTNVDGNTAGLGQQFAALQHTDVTSIVDQLKVALTSFLPPQALEGLEKMRLPMEAIFQSTMNTGYRHMFTVVAIIALVGMLATLFLKDNVKGV